VTARAFLDGRVTLHAGDCRKVIAELADASIDSVVCDPPYALVSISKRFANSPRNERTENVENPYGRTGAGFMGKKWDNGEAAFAAEFWAEVLRVLKPGGHVLAFSGTRTYHRLAVAIEDAGFEIRDQIGWAYGSGFPKSHDVSKGIDRVGGMPPDQQAALLRERRESAGLSRDELAELVGCTASSVRDWEEGRARMSGGAIEHVTPSKAYRAVLAERLGYSADERRLVGVSTDRRGDGTVYGVGHTGNLATGGHTDLSREWGGWGTALKPAWEPIVMARKPLGGTVAENVLEHGTGALNIDGCRVGWPGGNVPQVGTPQWGGPNKKSTAVPGQEGATVERVAPSELGRWPANIIHDGSDEVLAAFPDTDSGGGPAVGTARSKVNTYGEPTVSLTEPKGANSGSAARFFYSSKADSEDRLGSKHPTVKPLDLMQYLVRLVTPPGGLVLDPFAGTGTTGEAAFREGMRAVLIEREPEYQADIARRMDLAQNPTKRAAVAASKNNLQGAEGTPLFGNEAA
jgi:DNA modification methylase/transcriptional regulator with XRE-family HTH domain